MKENHKEEDAQSNFSQEEFPSLSEQGKNLAKFTFEVVKDVIDLTPKPITISEEKQKERLDICKRCDYFSPRQSRCKQCGCYLSHKIKFAISKCPIEKW